MYDEISTRRAKARAERKARATPATPGPAKNDVADKFLEHVRAVHFALIAASFALLVASSIRPQASLQRAFDEAHAAQALMQDSFANRGLDAFSKRMNVDFLVNGTKFEPLVQSGPVTETIKRTQEHLLGITDQQFEFSEYGWNTAVQSTGNFWMRDIDGGALDRDPTLEEFHEAWDFYRGANAVTMDGNLYSPTARLYDHGKLLDAAGLARLRAFFQAHSGKTLHSDHVKLGLREDKDPSRLLAIRHWYAVAEMDPDTRMGDAQVPVNEIWFPIAARRNSDIAVQAEVLPPQGPVTLSGTFVDSFGDLIYYTKGLESLKLSELVGFLRERYQTDGKQIQLFGIELPQSAISQWGLMILLACQLYFVVHLARSAEYWQDQPYPFPWVALYPGIASRVVSILSVTTLPIAAAILLCWQGWEGSKDTTVRSMLALGGLIATALSVATVRIMPKNDVAADTAAN